MYKCFDNCSNTFMNHRILPDTTYSLHRNTTNNLWSNIAMYANDLIEIIF